jgi:hypothetical protein
MQKALGPYPQPWFYYFLTTMNKTFFLCAEKFSLPLTASRLRTLT